MPQENQEFSSWSRSTAFNLNLSKNGIMELMLMDFYEKQHRSKVFGHDYSGYSIRPSDASYLQRRGLIERCKKDGYGGNWILTEAGEHVCQLLLIAGFKTELHDLLDKKE